MASCTSGVGVAQLAEHWIVAPVVVGSNPIAHPPQPTKPQENQWSLLRRFVHGWAELSIFGDVCSTIAAHSLTSQDLVRSMPHRQSVKVYCKHYLYTP